MTSEASEVQLSAQDLRVVARYAAESAQEALSIFEAAAPLIRRALSTSRIQMHHLPRQTSCKAGAASQVRKWLG
jgi:hypothetical protein